MLDLNIHSNPFPGCSFKMFPKVNLRKFHLEELALKKSQVTI